MAGDFLINILSVKVKTMLIGKTKMSSDVQKKQNYNKITIFFIKK